MRINRHLNGDCWYVGDEPRHHQKPTIWGIRAISLASRAKEHVAACFICEYCARFFNDVSLGDRILTDEEFQVYETLGG